MSASIQPLPPEVVAQIKSSIVITSLNSVVSELVKNSLDANSTKIDINIDYARGGCVVEDDGHGILPTEFREAGGLGKLHHTSKLNSKNPVHGNRGSFLASLSAVALLSITSRHHLYHPHNTLSMHKSQVVARQTPAPPQQHIPYSTHGTRVTVRDLFGSMPVRVKQRAITTEKQRGNIKDWDELKRNVVLLLLAWSRKVAVTIRETGTLQKMTIRPPIETNVCDILSQASFITPTDKSSWVQFTASTEKLQIDGSASLDPSATKRVQFISLGIQPLFAVGGQSILHDEINRLFQNSAFGNEEELEELNDAEKVKRANDGRYKSDGYTNREMKGKRKGVDRWPMFYINIQPTQSSRISTRLDVDGIFDKENDIGAILKLLQAAIWQFLTQNQFRPKCQRGQRLQRSLKEHSIEPQRIEKSVSDMKSPIQSRKPHRANPAPNPPNAEDPGGGKQKPSDAQRLSVDSLLGTGKPEVFRQSASKLDSPFDTWSRIKKGARRNVPRQSHEGKLQPSNIQRPTTTTSSLPIRSSEFECGTKALGPLISSTGKIIRRPFADTTIQNPKLQSQSTTPKTLQRKGDDDSKVIEWVNPITKVKSLVNHRTGLTVAAKQAGFNFGSDIGSAAAHEYRYSRQNLKRNKTGNNGNPSPWISKLLATWENPIFSLAEIPIPQISTGGLDISTQDILHGRQHHCSQIDIDRAFKYSSAGINSRISKDGLRTAEVITQVDRKFVLIKVKGIDTSSTREQYSDDSAMLILVDQHAADERIRIESLLEELCTPSQAHKPTIPSIESGILTITLQKPLAFDVTSIEIDILSTYRSHFAGWGILYDLPNEDVARVDSAKPTRRIIIRSLPPGIIERCKIDPRVLIELIRAEAWKCAENGAKARPSEALSPQVNQGHTSSWLQRIHSCPQGIMDMLNSRACRSAIMFNDELSREQCELLVKRLAACIFPFQCAHGRPSLVPLVDLGKLRLSETKVVFDPASGEGKSFGSSFRAWKKCGYL